MSSSAYLPFLIQIVLAALIGAVVIGASHFFGQRSKTNAIKDSPYECGLQSEGIVNNRFTARFFVTALLFLVFDIEVVFLLPWVFIYREFLANQIAIFWPILCFLGVLVLGLFYEMKKGALTWEK
jgi:NADH-quinone oxidoreductase subunit A